MMRNDNRDLTINVVNPDKQVALRIQKMLPGKQVNHLCDTLEEYVALLD
jgi:hypothetical protein